MDLKSALTQVMMMKKLLKVTPSRHLTTVSSKIGVEGIYNIENDAEIIELNLMKDFNCQLSTYEKSCDGYSKVRKLT